MNKTITITGIPAAIIVFSAVYGVLSFAKWVIQ